MLSRRGFLGFLSAVPVLGRLVPKDSEPTECCDCCCWCEPESCEVTIVGVPEPLDIPWRHLTIEYRYPRVFKSRPHGILSEFADTSMFPPIPADQLEIARKLLETSPHA